MMRRVCCSAACTAFDCAGFLPLPTILIVAYCLPRGAERQNKVAPAKHLQRSRPTKMAASFLSSVLSFRSAAIVSAATRA
eukprot:5936534-Pyramimonas_sp.AAC.2